MASQITVLAEIKCQLCKMSGISKAGKPYEMLVFKYNDGNLGKDVFLRASNDSDRNALDLMYLKGWMPPQNF